MFYNLWWKEYIARSYVQAFCTRERALFFDGLAWTDKKNRRLINRNCAQKWNHLLEPFDWLYVGPRCQPHVFRVHISTVRRRGSELHRPTTGFFAFLFVTPVKAYITFGKKILNKKVIGIVGKVVFIECHLSGTRQNLCQVPIWHSAK